MAEAEKQIGRNWSSLTLRSKLFLASALLSSAILVVAAWVINNQVVAQARQQVQMEIETSLPLYDSIWNEQSRRLATLGLTMANSPVNKNIFGDPRASRDRETIREMAADFSEQSSERVDLILISDGAGQITFADVRGETPHINELAAARAVAERQNQQQGFALLDGKLFQLALTPMLVHSGSADYQNTLAVFGTGSRLSRETALEIKHRVHSDVIFFVADQLHASSLDREAEAEAAQALAARDLNQAAPTRPMEVSVGGELHLAFARPLRGFDGQRVGQFVVLRSLSSAGNLFRQISNRLLLLWSLSLAAALVLSYLIAGRITRPIEALAAGARELGRGNYEYEIRARARDEIGQLAQTFDQMRLSLKRTQTELLKSERLATIGQMAGSIIHDLRNPLATMATAAEMLGLDGLPPDRKQTLLESQLRAADRMNGMLEDLLEFSRGRYHLKLERCSLAAVVSQGLQGLIAATQAGIAFEVAISPELWINADAERLRRVFENLFVNAIQAMPHGGKITVQALEEDERVGIHVRDNGPGVPLQIRARLFEPFVGYGKRGSTGLGLAIARGIVEAHGGIIRLNPASDQGADFYLDLPREK
jgi:signal transduction histidine kinase